MYEAPFYKCISETMYATFSIYNDLKIQHPMMDYGYDF